MTGKESSQRNRWPYITAAVLLLVAALPARLVPGFYPPFVVLYVGDFLWAMMLYLVVVILFPAQAGWKLAAFLLPLCYLVEISQLYQADWANRLRHIPGVGLLLGYGFLWSDMLAYTLGVGAGLLLDQLLLRRVGKPWSFKSR